MSEQSNVEGGVYAEIPNDDEKDASDVGIRVSENDGPSNPNFKP